MIGVARCDMVCKPSVRRFATMMLGGARQLLLMANFEWCSTGNICPGGARTQVYGARVLQNSRVCLAWEGLAQTKRRRSTGQQPGRRAGFVPQIN